MPVLTYPAGFYPQVDGDPLLPNDINKLFFDGTDAAFDESLEIINGGLDFDNIDASWLVAAEHTQRGAMLEMGAAGRTANLDWRWSWAGAFSSPGVSGWAPTAQYPGKYIPGSAIEIDCSYDGLLLLTWEVFWMNDKADTTAEFSHVYLEVDGVYVPHEMRQISRCCADAMTDPRAYQRARAWSGHALVSVSAGFHSAGLLHLADKGIRNTRHWASNIKYVLFKYS